MSGSRIDQRYSTSSSSDGDEEEGEGDAEEGGGPRRSGRSLSKSIRLTDQGFSSSSSADGDSDSDAEPDVVGSEEEEEEGEEDESDDSVSGVETIRVENVTVRHKLYTSAASCFCSACRVCDDDKCTIFPKCTRLLSLGVS